MCLTYRWLGVAGLEFSYHGYTLLIDPFFTRPGKVAVLAGWRVMANSGLIGQHITRADAVLVTHPHYDHLLDVPEILRRTGAQAFGSLNTCALLSLQGIPTRQVQQIQVGDHFDLGPFSVEVFPASHTRIPFTRWLNGELPPNLVKGNPHMPLRLSDYRMDTCYSFKLKVDHQIVLISKYPTPADVLFASPYNSDHSLESVLPIIKPHTVIPIHWDDFTRPLSLSLRPMLLTPAQGLRPIFPPLRRLDLQAFAHEVQQILPEAELRFPEIFRSYPINI